MKRTFILIGALILGVCLLAGACLSGDAGGQEQAIHPGGFKPSQPAFTGDGVFLLKASLNKREPVTITLGGLPFSKGGKSASYSDLDNFTGASHDLMRERYLYPAGNVIGFGYGIEGYLEVGLWNGPPPPETAFSIESLYAMLDRQARSMGIEDIPVRFKVLTSPPIVILDADPAGPQYR
ncbi:MAG: hypothetical protein M0P22_04295 [Methanoculleus sp.]|nr:hypothetical protein [Methanoculleus sp.]